MNKKILLVSLLLTMSILTTSFGLVLARPFYKVISIEKTYSMIFIETHHDLLVIDVRPPTDVPVVSYDLGHIPGAINIPMGPDLMTWIAGEGQNHLNDKIIVNCWLGVLSPNAAQMLIDEGFKKVFQFIGIRAADGHNFHIHQRHYFKSYIAYQACSAFGIGDKFDISTCNLFYSSV